LKNNLILAKLEKRCFILLSPESEKARSEFIIAPILFEWQEHNQNFTLYSGRNFDVDAKRGLTGECDFIITLTPPMQTIHAPVITMLEAKKQNIEQHLGQCAAQMIGAKQFNEQKDKQEIDMIFGCVTTGEAWQFLKLRQNTLTIDSNRYYLNDVAVILGVLQIISENFGSPTT